MNKYYIDALKLKHLVAFQILLLEAVHPFDISMLRPASGGNVFIRTSIVERHLMGIDNLHSVK